MSKLTKKDTKQIIKLLNEADAHEDQHNKHHVEIDEIRALADMEWSQMNEKNEMVCELLRKYRPVGDSIEYLIEINGIVKKVKLTVDDDLELEQTKVHTA